MPSRGLEPAIPWLLVQSIDHYTNVQSVEKFSYFNINKLGVKVWVTFSVTCGSIWVYSLLSMLFEILRWSFITRHWNLRWQLMTVQVWNFTNSLLIKMNHENGFFWDNVEGRLKIFCRKVPLDAIITWEKENQNSWPKIFVGKFTKKLILVQCALVALDCNTYYLSFFEEIYLWNWDDAHFKIWSNRVI